MRAKAGAVADSTGHWHLQGCVCVCVCVCVQPQLDHSAVVTHLLEKGYLMCKTSSKAVRHLLKFVTLITFCGSNVIVGVGQPLF